MGGLWLVGGNLPYMDQLSTMPSLPALGWVAVLALTLVVRRRGDRLAGSPGRGCASAHPWPGGAAPDGPLGAVAPDNFWLDSGMRGFPLLLLPGFFVGMAAGAVVLGWLYERALQHPDRGAVPRLP